MGPSSRNALLVSEVLGPPIQPGELFVHKNGLAISKLFSFLTPSCVGGVEVVVGAIFW